MAHEEEERLRAVALQNAQSILVARRQAEEALRQQTEWLRVALASIGDAVISTDAQGRITFMNGVAEMLTGYPQAEALHRPLPEIFRVLNERTRQPVESPALRALREDTIVRRSNHSILIARDGREWPIDESAAPMRDETGVPVGSVLVFRDVTERKRAEEMRERLAAIVDSSEDAIVSKTLDGIIQSWNGGAERLFGYTAAEAVGQSITLIIPPERLDEERTILERLRRGERIEHFETVRVARDGRRMDISLTISPIRDGEGRIIGTSKVARDVTERRRAEAERREAERRKDEFLALLAHELRNPLAPLRNGLQVMRLAAGDRQAITSTRDMMERQLGHLVRLVDDLLDISRIGRNRMELRRTRVLLADVVRSAVETARPAIEEAAHQLTLSLPPEPISLDADPTRLAQVFSNLLSNSAKYTPPGGHIILAAERQGESIVVSVQDDGIGIPAGFLHSIFDMFAQVDRSIERSTGGLGIGLALVKGLVEMHGGTVQAASDGVGRGSTFTVRLPLLPLSPEPPSADPSPAGAALRGTGRRVLVVDDNRDSALSMMMMLELTGNEVRIAHDGIEAVRMAEDFRPQVILMDMGMPRLNGYDATRRIRAQAWGRAITIVALTGWGQEGDRERTRASGCDGHLVKPVSLAELDRLLGELAEKTHQSP